MENEVMNEVMENDDEVVNEIVPVEAETYDETSDESTLSKKDMIVGAVGLVYFECLCRGCAYGCCEDSQ